MRVLIVDDHPLIRHAIRDLLEPEAGASVEEAGTQDEALAHIRAQHWDVILLEISMPGHTGLQMLTTIHAEQPELPVLIVSGRPEDQYAVRLLRAGASGYVSKESAPEVLLRAVRRVANGGRFISETLAEQLASGMRDPEELHETLSNREYEVLRHTAHGRSSSEIAAALNLSVKTISTYRTRLLHKLGARTTADLIRYAFQHALVEERRQTR
jgi:DNA-binding NarL/FixJ family response regulator